MAKKLTPEQEQEFAHITADVSSSAPDEAFRRNLYEKRDNDMRLSPELQAFFDQEISQFFRR